MTSDVSAGTGVPASIVIPAHNEASVIDRCLESLAQDPTGWLCEVVVAANGCSDDTAARARAFEGRFARLVVLDLPTPGKVGALNAGDEAATALPRIYLDADIELGPGALTALVAGLTTNEAVVASPHIHFDLTGSDLVVRQFYAMFAALPYVRDGLVGLGVYGLSPSGRARYDRFPELTADDLYVQRLFRDSERRNTEGTFTVQVPRTAKSLVTVRTRVARGNAELADAGEALSQDTLDASSSTTGTTRAMLDAVRRNPKLLPAAVAYAGVTAIARRRAVKAGADTAWERDDSTRSTSQGEA